MGGAAFDYAPLWPALFSFPLMAAVRLMCTRLSMVSGRDLATVIRRRYSRPVLWGACALLIVVNVINIGADFGGMAEVSEMMTGVKAFVWTPRGRGPRRASSFAMMRDMGAVADVRIHGATRERPCRVRSRSSRARARSPAAELVRRSFRKWYQAHYPYIFAKFRCVSID